MIKIDSLGTLNDATDFLGKKEFVYDIYFKRGQMKDKIILIIVLSYYESQHMFDYVTRQPNKRAEFRFK